MNGFWTARFKGSKSNWNVPIGTLVNSTMSNLQQRFTAVIILSQFIGFGF
jgi:hypothetical protein